MDKYYRATQYKVDIVEKKDNLKDITLYKYKDKKNVLMKIDDINV